MSEYHKRLKSEIRKIKLDTLALRRATAELKDYDPIVQVDAYQNMVDAHIEEMAETNNWSK
tara:strand:- start:369 stop:551 length:183 start_codon:yes stop_codon:yes gene_type:complete